MLKRHKIERSSVVIPHEEDQEVIAMAKKLFKDVVNLETGKPEIQCIECNKTYHKRYSKKEHVKMYHLNEVHRCRTCGAVFKTGDQ